MNDKNRTKKTKKILTSKQYVRRKGACCPVCTGKKIFELEGGKKWATITCQDCKSNWTEVYKLTGYDNLNKGET